MIIYSIWIFVYFLCVMQTQWSGYFSLVSQPMRLQCAGTTTLSHISAQERPVLHFLYSTSAPSCVQLILVAWPTVPQSTMIPSSCTCNRTTSGLHPPPKKNIAILTVQDIYVWLGIICSYMFACVALRKHWAFNLPNIYPAPLEVVSITAAVSIDRFGWGRRVVPFRTSKHG